MKTVYDTILACRATGSKNEKLAILTKQFANHELRLFLRTCYEPRINFYMKKIDVKLGVKDKATVPEFNAELVRRIIFSLNTRQLSGNAAKAWIASLYVSFANDWERELLTMLIERDVKAGFSESTINKVWQDEITDVPYMRCCLPKDAKLNDFPWAEGVFSQIKADGMFANVNHNDDGSVEIMSRNGSPFPIDNPAFAKLINEVKLHIPRGHQVHGELLMWQNGKMLPRQEGNGKFNTLLQSGDLDNGYTVQYECWDLIPIKEAKAKNKFKRYNYMERYEQLGEAVQYDPLSSVPRALTIIETRLVYSLKEAYAHYSDALERGLEGTIVKHPYMIWEDTTSKRQVKLKLEFECDLRIVGFNEGKNKYVGMLGSFQCETEDGQLEVNVAGFTDDMRKEFWDNRDLYMSKIITVKSNSIMLPTRKEKYSLFLPIFVEVRLDKKTADTLKRVQEQYDATIASVGS